MGMSTSCRVCLSFVSDDTFTHLDEPRHQVVVWSDRCRRHGRFPVVKLLDGLKPYVIPRLVDPEGKGTTRVLISTPLAESEVAAYLTQLAAKVEPKGVKVGSYPRWGRSRNTVTLVGRFVLFPRRDPRLNSLARRRNLHGPFA